MEYKIFWSEEAIRNLEEILDYLNHQWTQKGEVANFKKKLGKYLDLIVQNPFLFPISNYNQRLRKAVMSQQTTIFYEIKENLVYVAYLFVNRKNIERIK
ncbi:MAG TPA: type II toxin-antitoxin system RelE/ParE family toxin [Prolixibacteraceae bacterium]|nr:type II toxin-antitoxin system RelE/ParE family toxin [Prolixibacteraceae bacterium]HPS12166.1 type II toxin-antitoxin system RelE/ParE family toxin [Prolixibacteraceae bacterium]